MQKDIKAALIEIIQDGKARTQQEMCKLLIEQGFLVNQTKISRLLHKVGAIKIKDSAGRLVYHIDQEQTPPQKNKLIKELILEFETNDYLIVVHTQPGSAAMVARLIDFNRQDLQVLGTLAGDDTVVIIPERVEAIPVIMPRLKAMLAQ